MAGRPRLSPWIDGNVRPVRVGVYQRRAFDTARYARWDGKRWFLASDDRDEAANSLRVSSIQSALEWRGRAEPTR